MLLWKNDHFHDLTKSHAKQLFPIICPYLYHTATLHWNTAIKNLAVSVIRFYMDRARDVFDACSIAMKDQEQRRLAQLLGRKGTWKTVLASAVSQDTSARLNESFGALEEVFPRERK
jgi:serine/threonine-protein phosphatase 2A regulatory subunit B'